MAQSPRSLPVSELPLPKDASLVLNRFFRWRRWGMNRVTFLTDEVLKRPDAEMSFERLEVRTPLVRIDRLVADGEEVGHSFLAHPKGRMRFTAGFVHIGEPSEGRYDPVVGVPGVQVYAGESDVILISTAIGERYLAKVRSDIIV